MEDQSQVGVGVDPSLAETEPGILQDGRQAAGP